MAVHAYRFCPSFKPVARRGKPCIAKVSNKSAQFDLKFWWFDSLATF